MTYTVNITPQFDKEFKKFFLESAKISLLKKSWPLGLIKILKVVKIHEYKGKD